MDFLRNLTDSHFHIGSMENKGLLVQEILEQFFSNGGKWALDAGVHTHKWEERLSWNHKFSGIRFSAGIHPEYASAPEDPDWQALEVQAAHPLVLAVGEIGLDYFYDKTNMNRQKDFFIRQLDLAQRVKKPIMLHIRDAAEDALEILEPYPLQYGGVFHCFTFAPSIAQKALDKGFYLSFAGNLTFPKATAIQESAKIVPLDRFLLETDSPYLAPQVQRGKPCDPRMTALTALYFAQLRGLEVQNVIDLATANFERLYGLNAKS